MSAHRTTVQLITKAGIFFGALVIVGVLLAAMPAHKVASAQNSGAQESQSAKPDTDNMAGMDMGEKRAAETGAVHDMTPAATTLTACTCT